MTADNAEGGAMPPTTHYAIRACCLICKASSIDTLYTDAEYAECYNRDAPGYNGNNLNILHSCEHFKLRDFGYPVRTVEME